jgi:cytochrome c oxidase subunit 3
MNDAAAPTAAHFELPAQQDLAARFGMWIFLATELLFFGPLFLGYLYVRLHFGAAVGLASRHTDFLLGTVNTAVLLTSSLCVACAGAARDDGAARRAARWLLAAVVCGVLFLAIKGAEYHAEFGAHLFPGAGFAPSDARGLEQRHGMQLFFLLYFALTALHALHLIIGISACGAQAWLLWRRGPQGASVNAVEVAGLYWHFVDVVWIFLYPMLYLVQRAGGS